MVMDSAELRPLWAFLHFSLRQMHPSLMRTHQYPVFAPKSKIQRRFHYAWVVAAVTFAVLLVTAAVRATPGVLMVPLEQEFGWTSAAISGAIAINIALFGLI